MVMLKPPGKAQEVAKKVLKEKGIKVPKKSGIQKTTITGPYLQH